MKMMHTILIFDPCPVFGLGLKMILEKESDLIVSKIIHSREEIVDQIKSVQPELLMISSNQSNGECVVMIRKIRILFPQIPLFVIVNNESACIIEELIRMNVDGIVQSCLDPEKFVQAIQMVLTGRKFYSDEAWKEMLRREISHPVNIMHTSDKPVLFLSRRENEILRNIAEGLTHRQIADKLFISPRTVETHRDHILAKLNLKNTADIIRYAYLHQEL
jgi:DNA-binding NarL/FixJ family response regulator